MITEEVNAMLIGITGEMGSGKTTLANILANNYGFTVIHGDEVAHEVLTLDRYNHVLSWFNLLPAPAIDRHYLGHLLFQDEKKLQKYNAYIYTFIKKRIDEIRKEANNCVIDWNFLPITSLMEECDITILMKCNESIRRKRVKLRDKIDDDYFDMRNQASLKYDDNDFDFIFINEGEYALDKNVKKYLEELIWK